MSNKLAMSVITAYYPELDLCGVISWACSGLTGFGTVRSVIFSINTQRDDS